MSALVDLSNDLARAVERIGPAVVAVSGRPHLASTGVHWAPGVVVTADHTLAREEEITVATRDGRTMPATPRPAARPGSATWSWRWATGPG